MAEERLRIVVGTAGDDLTRRALLGVEGAIGSVRSAASRLAGVLGLSGAGLGAAFVVATKQAIDHASAIVDAADRVGVGVEQYQRLAFAAKQSGVDQGALDVALTKVSVAISRAADGSGEAADTFDRLGIAVRGSTGAVRPAADVIEDIADRIAGIPSGADRARVAVELFGRSGAALVPLLAQGSDGVRALTGEADALGIVLEEGLARRLEETGDRLEALGAQFDASKGRLVGTFLPEIEGAIDLFGDLTRMIEGSTAALRLFPIGPRPPARGNQFWVQIADLMRSAPQPLDATPAPPAILPPEDDSPDRGFSPAKFRAGIDAAKRDAEAFTASIEAMRESTARSVFATAGLVLDEFAAARVEADRELSETLSKIEEQETRAVDLAKGAAEKIALAREEAHRAEIAALERHEAERTSIVKRAADERARSEADRASAVESLLGTIPDDSARVFDQAKESALDLTNIVETGLGQALATFGNTTSSAMTDLIRGTKDAESVFSSFADSVISSLIDVATQQLVNITLQAILSAFGGGGSSLTSGAQAHLDVIADLDKYGGLGGAFPFAAGGIVTRPTFALIGEGGEPEAVVPLSKSKDLGFGGSPEVHSTVIVNMGAGGARSEQQSQQNDAGGMARLISGLVSEAIRKELRPGGQIDTRLKSGR